MVDKYEYSVRRQTTDKQYDKAFDKQYNNTKIVSQIQCTIQSYHTYHDNTHVNIK